MTPNGDANDGEREDATQEVYNRVADDYAVKFFAELDGKPLDRALLRLLAEEAPDQLPVADVGCGPGHVARYLHGLGRRVIGIDLSPRMIAVARERTPAVPFQVGSMLALNAADGAWGGIVAFYSIIHLSADELPRAFSELHRALAPAACSSSPSTSARRPAWNWTGTRSTPRNSWVTRSPSTPASSTRPRSPTSSSAPDWWSRRASGGALPPDRGRDAAHLSARPKAGPRPTG
jgi:SAM-dependent methyltransferase